MNNPLSLIFFLLFAIILVWMYLALRRGWMSSGFIVGAGTAGTIITMLLMSVSQGNQILHAVVNGIILGSLFSLATFGIATFFGHRTDKAT